METARPAAGLRERKKQKTRDTIVSVARELFAEQGYEKTTIAEIADAAEVSPRTIFAYFASKEDILFCDFPELEERLARALRERPEGVTALDALRAFIVGSIIPDHDEMTVHKSIVAGDEALQRSERARFAPLEELMVEAIAEDLDAGPDDIRPRIVAAAVMAAFTAVHDPSAPPEPPKSREEAIAKIDDVMGFLRGGLEALRDR